MKTKAVQVKKIVKYAKNYMLPDDLIEMTHFDGDIKIVCQQKEGYDLRLFVWFREEPVGMFTYYDDKADWMDETNFFNDCWGGN